ncbi:MAG: hypothetical protein C5B48_08640 [Candidatus Rokuibacteriota bacterium]|nr:MAG: hypothetical protein C5B48_08640 [Candidatus Rokubacteria bacterium]
MGPVRVDGSQYTRGVPTLGSATATTIWPWPSRASASASTSYSISALRLPNLVKPRAAEA